MPMLKPLMEVVDRIDPNTGLSEKVNQPYLLIIKEYGEEEKDPYEVSDSMYEGTAYAMRGRRITFNFIIESLNIYNVDLLKSYILSGNLTLGRERSLYTFLRLCIEKYRYGGIDYTTDILNQSVIDAYAAEGKEITETHLASIYNQEQNS